MSFKFSGFSSILDTVPAHNEVEWSEFVAQLRKPFVTTEKKAIGLFNATVFDDAGLREKEHALEVHALVLDFDNTRLIPDPDDLNGHKKRKIRIDNPIFPSLVETLLADYEFVIATSFSHTEDWPKFRVIVPFDTPIQANKWVASAEAALHVMGLSNVGEGLDRCYRNLIQQYYWPCHKPNGLFYFKHNIGKLLPAPDPTVIKRAKEAAPRGGGSGKRDDRFTPEQIAKYYADRIPAFPQDDTREWREFCPFHGGEGQYNFTVNAETGSWICFSQCNAGGDIYAFELRLRYNNDNKQFGPAKKAVNEFLGIDDEALGVELVPPAVLAERIQQHIQGEPIPDELIFAIAAQPKTKVRSDLLKQLVITHQLVPEEMVERVTKAREELKSSGKGKIVRFPKANVSQATLEAAAQQLAEQMASQQPDDYGLLLPPNKYVINRAGVFPVKGVVKDDVFSFEVQTSRPVATRPIWPGAMGCDLATDATYVRVHWVGSDFKEHAEWHPGAATNSREALLSLDDAPVSLGKVSEVSDYFTVAKACMVSPFISLTSKLGWVGAVNDLRFVFGTESDIEYIGRPNHVKGTLAGWVDPLYKILQHGIKGYILLAVLGLAAASPLVRLMGRRNPIIGLVSDSSLGKGTALNYALSIWGDPATMTLPAGSTAKGTQDMSNDRMDLPILFDEMQQTKKLNPRLVEDIVYYMGNGQRRVTSSRSQVARGGERRWGTSFYASENPIVDYLQRGVQYRTIELHGAPVPDGLLAGLINSASSKNAGTVGLELVNILNAYRDDFYDRIDDAAIKLQLTYPSLQGDDAYAIAFAFVGLEMLADVTGVTLPCDKVRDWLADQVGFKRTNTKDYGDHAWITLIDSIVSANWTSQQGSDVLEEPGYVIACRGTQLTDPATPLEINPTAPRVMNLLRALETDDSIAKLWADRGWLARQGPNLKWQRRAKNKAGDGARMWRVTEKGMNAAGLTTAFQEFSQEVTD